MVRTTQFILILGTIFLTSCANHQIDRYRKADQLNAFDSDTEALAYIHSHNQGYNKLEQLVRTLDPKIQPNSIYFVEEIIATGMRASVSESITNNQEDDVDEGGIIKRHGDYLLVLRRGVVYSIRIGNTIEKISELPVQPESWQHGTWYDEMLVYDGRIIITGFSYDSGFAEYIFLTIDDHGTLEWDSAYFIDAGDYYSANNYASRLIDGNLVFYMTDVYLDEVGPATSTKDFNPKPQDEKFDLDELEPSKNPLMPRVIKFGKDAKPEDIYSLFNQNKIYSPIMVDQGLSATVIAVCPLDSTSFSCRAITLLGGRIADHYVSKDAFYLWMRGDSWNMDYEIMPYPSLKKLAMQHLDECNEEVASAIYRVPLDGSPVGAVKVPGWPLDQFSFKELEGELFVIGQQEVRADPSSCSHHREVNIFLARMPVSSFRNDVSQIPVHQVHNLARGDYDLNANRFIQENLLLAMTQDSSDISTQMLSVNIMRPEVIGQLEIDVDVTQIQPLGSNALLIGQDINESLIYATLNLSTPFFVIETLSGMSGQLTEDRSHAFFYRPDHLGGIFGTPVTQEMKGRKRINDVQYHLEDIVDMQFVRVNKDLGMFPLGALKGDRVETWFNYQECDYSCTDWYGSARPIFWSNRIFALLKNELIEGRLSGDKMEEVERIDIRE